MTQRSKSIAAVIVIALVMMLAAMVGLFLDDRSSDVQDNGLIVEADDPSSTFTISITSDEDARHQVDVQAWQGNGTKEDPYIIENQTFIGDQSDGLLVFNSNDEYYIIRNNTFFNGTRAIDIIDSPNKVVENNSIDFQTQIGIRVDTSNNTTIRGNTIFDTTFTSDGTGIVIMESEDCIVDRNRVYDVRNPIRVVTCIRTEITDNDVTASSNPGYNQIVAVRSNIGNITGNKVEGTMDTRGILVSGSTNFRLRDNDLDNTFYHVAANRFDQWNTTDIDGTNTINGTPILYLVETENMIVNQTFSQLIMYRGKNVTIDGVRGPPMFGGFYIQDSNWINITNNQFLCTGDNYVRTISDDIRFENNTFHYTHFQHEGDDFRFIDNTVQYPKELFWYDGEDGIFEGNTFSESDIGIALRPYSSNGPIRTRIANNTFNNVNKAIWVQQSVHYMTVMNNTFNNGSIAFQISQNRDITKMDVTSHTITRDNMVNGYPILYLSGVSNRVIEGDWGEVILANCSQIVVRDASFPSGGTSVVLAHSDNITVDACTFIDNTYSAITSMNNTNITISDSTFRGCYQAMHFADNEDVDVLRNRIIGTSTVSIEMDNNDRVRIINNLISASGSDGIWAWKGEPYEIVRNQIEGCSGYGLNMLGYTSAMVHHNNFIDNNKSVSGDTLWPQCRNYVSTSDWDDGAEGNYWSDYQDRYPSANRTGGVWDVPYNVSWYSRFTTKIWREDLFPLIDMVDVTPPTLPDMDNMTVNSSDTVHFDATGIDDDIGIGVVSWLFVYHGSNQSVNGTIASFHFDIPGTYEITLWVEDTSTNWNTTELWVFVSDNVPPTAHAGDDITVDQGTNVSLDGSASSDHAGIVKWTWTFFYNRSTRELHGRVSNFTFDTPGVYTITLNVTDGSGLWATDSLTVTVRDIIPPRAMAGGTISTPQDVNLTLNATRSTDNVGIVSYTWTFEYDGEIVTLDGPVVGFTFRIPGRYYVTLTVEDAAGNSDIDLALVVVRDTEPPEAASPKTVEAFSGDTVIFDASASTDNVGIVTYTWTFVYDGETVILTGATPEFTFDTIGVYHVMLELVDAASNIGYLWIAVSVTDAIAPVADAGSDVTVDQGATVTLDGSDSTDERGILGWNWTFEYDGEEITLQGETAEFTFNLAGVYDITLTVFNGHGLFGTDVVRVTVLDIELPIADAGEGIEVEKGEAFTLDATASTDNVGITTWSWSVRLGDGTLVDTGSGKTTEMILEPGLYAVTLTVVDAAGNEALDTVSVLVKSANFPVADAGEDIQVEAGDEAIFDGSGTTSVNAIELYEWTFRHDDQDVTLEHAAPSFRFTIPGSYQVTLTVVDTEGNPGLDDMTVTVVDTTPPVPRLKVEEVDDSRRRVLDGSESKDVVGVVNWTWEIVFENEITHLYGPTVDLHRTDPGSYRVTLTVRDAAGNEAYDGITFDISEDDGGISTALLIGVIVAVAIIAVVVLAVLFVQRGKGPREGA